MKKLVRTLSQRNALLVSGFVFLILCILTNTVFKQDFSYLTQTWGYTPESAHSLLLKIGENGRKAHMLVFISDIAMVVTYTLFLIGANYRTFSAWVKNCHTLSVIVFSPVLLALVQLGEIAALAIFITHFDRGLDGSARLANSLTVTKYYLIVICFVLPLIGLYGKIIKTKRGKEMV